MKMICAYCGKESDKEELIYCSGCKRVYCLDCHKKLREMKKKKNEEGE